MVAFDIGYYGFLHVCIPFRAFEASLIFVERRHNLSSQASRGKTITIWSKESAGKMAQLVGRSACGWGRLGSGEWMNQ